jgi:hypothetical protein
VLGEAGLLAGAAEELAPTRRHMEHRGPRFGEDGAIGWSRYRPRSSQSDQNARAWQLRDP